MLRVIENIRQQVTLTDYKEKHRPQDQKYINNTAINPCLWLDFDCRPNDGREQQEIADWRGQPFIVSVAWGQFQSGNEHHRKAWFEKWSSGTRFEVRCLDGGAWDCSTCWDMTSSLDEANNCQNQANLDQGVGITAVELSGVTGNNRH